MLIEGSIGVKSALIVEGGAMRGIFAAGVLDHFFEIEHRPFDFCIGVSAGSTNLAAWLANQPGRSHRVITDYSCRKPFIDLPRFFRGGHWLDIDWLWDITIDEIPIDGWELEQQPIPLFVVTTNVATGEAHYIEATEQNLNQLLKASCAVPIAYRHYPEMDGFHMTDGGVADSIPVIKAYEMGARDITVVLSRPHGYRKKAPKIQWLVRKLLNDTPCLAEAMMKRADTYNQAIDFIDNPPEDCRINVIVPPVEFEVGRVTTNSQKLQKGYEQGIAAAKRLKV
ncbi:patatin-like phospholipase family protein [Photobacterium sp. DNB23_23_1]|uniref:Patatin family protein n=1 Tax=Photobacterium pectinilyticum TaxID=2906793 RepID=A0ABT1N6X2_9GAMM|nr:patatin family protein [Photobacterium sp. ZSDE20]MCQ1060501.1 patatin family protein [Photobacterium sp. ZSDE20]MDD1827903.1 patatin family protein [Photobacterium sp. ZSDE20]